MKARTCRTTVQVQVARKPRQNRLIVRKLLPCAGVRTQHHAAR